MSNLFVCQLFLLCASDSVSPVKTFSLKVFYISVDSIY